MLQPPRARPRALLLGFAFMTLLPSAPSGGADGVVAAVAPLVPPTGALLGAHLAPGGSEIATRSAVEGLESTIGRTLDLDSHYYAWNEAFPSWKEPWDLSRGRTPLVTWAGQDPVSVLSGGQDDWIRARARALATLGKPVFVRWFPDMDLADASPLAPVLFVAAWRHLHDLFSAEGASNAVWVFCPSAEGFDSGTAPAYYPGDDFVDWVCADGFNWAPGQQSAPWRSFQQIFASFHAWGAGTGKPMMIAETGAQERGAGEKAAWIAAARSQLRDVWKDVRALVYFNDLRSFDWRISTSTSARDAFRQLADDQYFNYRSGTLFGAWVQPDGGWSDAQVRATVERLESDLGRRLAINHHFYGWSQGFPTSQETWDLSMGRVPLVTWGWTFTSQINSGSQDALITSRAEGLKGLSGTVLLRWFAEADTSASAGAVGTPSDYISAWRRIHNIFAERGATNVRFVWCPTAWGFKTGDAQKFYPGDAYVDWICADGFNWAPAKPGAYWASFAQIFQPFYDWAATRGKPLMIGETGVQERAPGEKAQWITAARTAIKDRFRQIRAFVYFDSLKQETSGAYDWQVDSTPASYDAFKAMGADPFFGTAASALLP